MIEVLPARANGDDWLIQRGRYLSTTFLVETGQQQYLVRLVDGRVHSVVSGPFVMPRWQFAMRFDQDAYDKYCCPLPPPGFHDLMAMIRFRTLRLEGDQHPFMANLLYFKDLFAKLRSIA